VSGVRRGLSVRRWAAALAVVVCLAGCAESAPSTLDAAGTGARRVEGLWWLLFWISVVGVLEVFALLGWALWRRRHDVRVRAGDATPFVGVLGVGIPFIVLVAVYGVGLRDLNALVRPPTEPQLSVEVIGHRWWWEVRYPEVAGAVTANEIHIPVDQSVRVRLRTADVQHSFWVPQLMPKTDLIAGKVNETWLNAERTGTFRGLCAEYCGLQHANMSLVVVAQPADEFTTWLRDLAAPVPSALTDQQRRGQAVFEANACAACHTVRGTTATGMVGPDLTTIGSRWSIGAGAAPNDVGHLGGWVVNPQTLKPGSQMPPQPVPASDLPDLLSYLQTLH
jgi:cytochrome c oxidase subunit II